MKKNEALNTIKISIDIDYKDYVINIGNIA